MPYKQPINILEAKKTAHMTKSQKAERHESEVKASDNNILAPKYLPEKQRIEFDRIAAELIEAKIMTNLDCDALGRYVSSESQYQKITETLLKAKTVNDKYFNLSNLQDKFFKQARSAAADLGLTITSRCKITMPKQEKKGAPSENERRFGNV